jgi:hypothetical protein
VIAFVLAMALASSGSVRALSVRLSRSDLERAIALARWPHTDLERVRFHDRYLTVVDGHLTPLSTTPLVIQVEIITEFRRAELIAEEHDRMGYAFGAARLDEVVDALRPWRGLLTIDAHLQLPGGCGPFADTPNTCASPLPPTEISVDGLGNAVARSAIRPFWYARSGTSPLPLGNVVEAPFAAAAIGQTTRDVRVIVDGRQLASVSIDFSTLE